MRPTTIAEVQAGVRESSRIALRGGGTKSAAAGDVTVMELTGLAGLTDYSPEECVFTALAGTPVRDVERLLAAHGQYLPFDPPFVQEGATLGGTIASGASGPRRYRYGGVRDFLIGIRLVDGDGRVIRSGGRVVKNAAGFLLHHGVVGSLGRFGVLAEVTFKVFPAPEARRVVTVECGSVEQAFAAARYVESLRRDCESIDFDERGTLRIELAGRAAAVDARAARLQTELRAGTTAAAPPGPCPSARVDHWVKVAGAMNNWETLRAHVAQAHFMCAGRIVWLGTADLPRLADALNDAGLGGLVLAGPAAGRRVGRITHNEFEERVRGVLDPQGKFSAAPDSSR